MLKWSTDSSQYADPRALCTDDKQGMFWQRMLPPRARAVVPCGGREAALCSSALRLWVRVVFSNTFFLFVLVRYQTTSYDVVRRRVTCLSLPNTSAGSASHCYRKPGFGSHESEPGPVDGWASIVNKILQQFTLHQFTIVYKARAVKSALLEFAGL